MDRYIIRNNIHGWCVWANEPDWEQCEPIQIFATLKEAREYTTIANEDYELEYSIREELKYKETF